MYSDKVLEPRQDPRSSVRAETIAALARQNSEVTHETESEKYIQACKQYDTAHANYLESFGTVTGAKSERNVAAGAALVGLAILTMAGTNLGWGIAFVVTVTCGALAVKQHLTLNEARDCCQAAIQRMYMEYGIAKKECGNAECVPSRPDQTCP